MLIWQRTAILMQNASSHIMNKAPQQSPVYPLSRLRIINVVSAKTMIGAVAAYNQYTGTVLVAIANTIGRVPMTKLAIDSFLLIAV